MLTVLRNTLNVPFGKWTKTTKEIYYIILSICYLFNVIYLSSRNVSSSNDEQ